MRAEFRKSFARDLRRRKNDSDFLDRVKEIIEEVELAETTARITNLKKLKGESSYYRIRFGNYRIRTNVALTVLRGIM
jgi:mRNA interferase RelE/StbE